VIVRRTRSPEETRSLGRELSRVLVPGDVVCLSGPLGSGKTCLIQGLIRGLGILEKVGSPSFVLVVEYSGALPVRHVVLYRLEGPSEMDGLGLEDLCDGQGIMLVEWGEKAEGRLAYSCHIVLEQGKEDERVISVRFEDPDREQDLLKRLD
jgi:tRNA threonylcarbamoyladenosine biosynthesis protein TsaE